VQVTSERSPEEITRLLRRAGEGEDQSIDELIPLVYHELRRMARIRLRSERDDHSLLPTDLVHEAYLRMVVQTKAHWNDRAHFFALASRAMRRILVDHARRHAAAKRPGVKGKIDIDRAPELSVQPNVALLELEEALQRLAEVDPRQARVVELRYFGGMTRAETAAVLGVSEATVAREWKAARLWLRRELLTASDADGR
jgi:RNA polymerase sigma factor (TIGR02999 family)